MESDGSTTPAKPEVESDCEVDVESITPAKEEQEKRAPNPDELFNDFSESLPSIPSLHSPGRDGDRPPELFDDVSKCGFKTIECNLLSRKRFFLTNAV